MKKNYNLKKSILHNILLCSVLWLSIYNISSQNLNFTMDTAIDDGTNTVILTETITQGSDVFVLSINHPGDETLDDLGGGDLVVYIGTGGSVLNESYIISLTKNNVPFSFTLNSLDYDTLEEGNISLENQADFAELTEQTRSKDLKLILNLSLISYLAQLHQQLQQMLLIFLVLKLHLMILIVVMN